MSAANRLAAWLLFVQGAASIAFVFMAGKSGTVTESSAFVGSASVDVFLGVAILNGSSRAVSFAIAREVLGALLLGAAALIAGFLGGLATIAAGAAIVYLLLGERGPDTRRLASAITVVALIGLLVGAHQNRENALELNAAADDALKGGPVTGESLHYSFVLPPGWRQSEDRDGADKSFSKPSVEAVLRCSASKVPRSAPIDSVVAEIVKERTLVEEQQLPSFGDRGRMLRVRWLQDGTGVEAWIGIFLSPDYVVQITGVAPGSVFHVVSDEIAAAIRSFVFPPDLPTLPPNAGPAVGTEFIDSSSRYRLTFPAGWHFMKNDDDAGASFDLRAFRPYRDAHVLTEAFPFPTPFTWASIEDAVLDPLRRSGRLQVVSRDQTHPNSRTIRVRLEAEGTAPIDLAIAFHRLATHMVVVRAFAPASASASLKGELDGIVSSFSPSPRRR